ncbi:hypothetical protein G6F43_001580 [Rhizopus delemar]|nr:hypothetical protein G6F43_001580 [Rhizopus delemar]
MGDINNNEPERFLTAADAFALFKRLQIEERIRKDEERHGSDLPLEISEYLDSMPTYELKEEFTRFKKQVARYRNDNWNKQHQINKEIIPELNKWNTTKETTVANWVKDIMKQAGIDTEKYGPHSIRSAASTKAVEKGHSIENVKQHANWSRNTQTFERFYYKPTTTLTLGSQITNSIFSTENLTILEAGAEAIEIVLGMTNNYIIKFELFFIV